MLKFINFICRPIGKGGFAVVMLIKSKFSQEYFAMKIMHRESILKNKGLITHILNEKKILTSLMPSSTIAKLVYCFKDNSYLYMVLEFLNGGTLYDYIYAYGRCGDYQAKYYAAQMILALQYLHHLEVLHRDIKLENIILDSHGIAKLTDFTFAKRIKLRTYTICGTVHYMAPGNNNKVIRIVVCVLILTVFCQRCWVFLVMVKQLNIGHLVF